MMQSIFAPPYSLHLVSSFCTISSGGWSSWTTFTVLCVRFILCGILEGDDKETETKRLRRGWEKERGEERGIKVWISVAFFHKLSWASYVLSIKITYHQCGSPQGSLLYYDSLLDFSFLHPFGRPVAADSSTTVRSGSPHYPSDPLNPHKPL